MFWLQNDYLITRLNKENELLQMSIRYIVWKSDAKPYYERWYSIDEFTKSREELEIDYEWYISQQIYYPLSRILQHIDVIDGGFICECLGLNPHKHSKIMSAMNIEYKIEENYVEKFLRVAQNKDDLKSYMNVPKNQRYWSIKPFII